MSFGIFLLIDQIFSLLFLCYLRIIRNSKQSKNLVKNFMILWGYHIQQRKVIIWFFSVKRSFSIVICKRNYIYQLRKMKFNMPFFFFLLVGKVTGELPSSMTWITTAFPSQEKSLSFMWLKQHPRYVCVLVNLYSTIF